MSYVYIELLPLPFPTTASKYSLDVLSAPYLSLHLSFAYHNQRHIIVERAECMARFQPSTISDRFSTKTKDVALLAINRTVNSLLSIGNLLDWIMFELSIF